MYQTSQQQMNDAFAFGMAMMFVGLMFGMVGSLVKGAMEPEGPTITALPQTKKNKSISQEIPQEESRVGQCYRLAHQFLAREEEGELIHGRLWNGSRWIDHAWVETETGYVYEPVADTFYRKEDFYKATKAQVYHRYSVEQAMINLAKNKNYGPWESSLLPQVMVQGGELLPAEYRYLTNWLREPLPEYPPQADWLPAVVPEVGERKIDAVLKQLKDGVESIQESAKFRLFLSTMARFHDYSIGNLILIAIQKPDATHVAGFNTWKDLGRWVKKGEKGIAILAPVMPPSPTCPQCGARIPKGARFCPECGASVEEVEIEVTPRRFIVVYVFDIEQTEGKPLPEFQVPALTGEANEELFNKVMALADSEGLTVSFESRPGQDPEIKGQYSGKTIWVRPEESRAQQLKSLIHEVAHYYSEGVFMIPRRDAETIAESAAFAVGAHFGFDSGVRSFPYVALWAQDKKVLEQNLGSVRRVAARMIEGLS